MKMMEKTLANKSIFEGKILKVELLDVELPDGKKAKREIVRHPGAVAMIAINDNKEVYLVKQFRKPSEEELLEIPAGKLEFGEDPLECARRELGEEIGFEANTVNNLASYYTSPGFTDEIVHIYLATDLVKVDVKRPEDEFLEVHKISIKEAIKKIENKEIKDGKTILGLLLVEKFFN